jgi:hypothetical protein
MKKIPVGATIAHAYRFAFSHFLPVLRALWIPLLLQLAVVLVLSRRMALLFAATAAKDPSAATLLGPVLLLFCLAVVLFAAQYAAGMEVALGRPPHSLFHVPAGRTMWRLLGGLITGTVLIIIIALILYVMISILSYAMGEIAKTSPSAHIVVTVIAILVAAAFFAFLALISIRFLFLLAPVNVTEQKLGIVRAWELSQGNFWRAFLVALSIFIPVLIANYAISFSVAGLPPSTTGLSKEAADAARIAWQVKQLNLLADRWYIALPATALMMLFQFSAGCAAQVFAYRALTEGSAPVTGDGLPD